MKRNFSILTLMVFTLSSTIGMAQSQKGGGLPFPDSGGVTLPLDEYNRLLELASKPVHKPETPPQNYSLQCADLNFRVENESVRGSLMLEGEIFKKGVTKVPLTNGMTTFDARQDGKGVPLQRENGIQTAVLNGPTDFSIDLSVGLPLRIEAGRASFTLPAPTAGSVRLALVIPGEHTFVNISPGLITSRGSDKGKTIIEATLVPGQPATIWWATRETVTQVTPKEVRFLSDVKTLVSVSEADLRIAALADITVVQGSPTEFEVDVPAGYEVTGVTGATLELNEMHDTVMVLKVSTPAQRHQFLISMERPISDPKATAPFLSFKNAQRETGEVLVEGTGTMELTATEGGGLKRMDVKEVSPYLRALSHCSPQAAFRFHRQSNEVPTLALEWTRFPDGSVLAAVTEDAVVTTMVTSEGKSLTEIKLTIKNQAQPFLKVALPAGASILSAEVGGEKVKPVQGSDGTRVPLLRPGFRPTGSYEVSFVFMHSGTPFAKKGGSELSLPSMDVPISLLHWEVFLPERYRVKDFGGDVISADLLPTAFREEANIGYSAGIGAGSGGGIGGGVFHAAVVAGEARLPGQVGGVVLDPSGATIPGAQVTITNTDRGVTLNTVTDTEGRWLVSNFPGGHGKIQIDANGFKTLVQQVNYDGNRPADYLSSLNVGTVAETIEVSAEAAPTNSRMYSTMDQLSKKQMINAPSTNVLNLQRRVAGVLPVVIDVPRAGISFQFARALVLDEETKVTFNYKSR
jgi:hypothetical protein